MALGANRGDAFRMLLGEMIRVVCIGIAFGLDAVVPATHMIRATIWGIKSTDQLSLGFVICLMLLIAGIAALLPARRAMKVDPMVALRYEYSNAHIIDKPLGSNQSILVRKDYDTWACSRQAGQKSPPLGSCESRTLQ